MLILVLGLELIGLMEQAEEDFQVFHLKDQLLPIFSPLELKKIQIPKTF
jgi:hypothetical protein